AETVTAAWLWAATAVAAGTPERARTALSAAAKGELGEVAEWLSLASRNEDERRVDRLELSLPKPCRAALPAVMYLAARAVPESSDAEVWLDRVFHEEHYAEPLLAMRARA